MVAVATDGEDNFVYLPIKVDVYTYGISDAPIVGDDIYGTSGERLMLHADTIEFIHPTSGEKISLQSKAEF